MYAVGRICCKLSGMEIVSCCNGEDPYSIEQIAQEILKEVEEVLLEYDI